MTRPRFLLYWIGIGALSLVVAYTTLVLLYAGDYRLDVFRTMLAKLNGYLQQGHDMYLDGRTSMHGFPQFYLKGLIYKQPAAMVVALVLALAVSNTTPRSRALVPLALAAIVVLYFSLSQYTLGLRFVLVCLPLFHVAAGRLAAPGPWLRVRSALAVLLVLLVAADVGTYYPYPRTYVDRAVVHAPGYTVLADSDMDWGEGLIALRDYVAEHGLGAIALSYHGSVDPALFGIRLSWLQDSAFQPPVTGALPEQGLLFVSATNLAGVYLGSEDPYRWLRARPPVAVVGGTIYVFDLDAVPANERWR